MPEPRKRRRTPAKGRRNLIVFGIILAGVAGLIVFAGISTRTPKCILPPESPEMTAKRESPENAFYAMFEAACSLPNRPAILFVASKSNPSATEPYYAPPGSIGDILNIDRPDDDEALLDYLLACQPAIEKLREGMRKESFLYPRIGTPVDMWSVSGKDLWGPYAGLESTLTGCMLAAARQPEGERLSVDRLSEALDLAERLGSDGGMGHYAMAASMMGNTLRSVPDAAATIPSRECLRTMRDAVNTVTLHERPARPYLEFAWRAVDNWAATGGSTEGGPLLHELFSRLAFMRQHRLLRKNKEELLEIAELPYAEFRKRWDGGLLPDEGWMYPYGGLSDIQGFIDARTQLQTARAGALIAINLELYRRGHGAYPETLNALVPDYLDALPTGSAHIAEEPFIYRPGNDLQKPGDYWLYPGPERDDLDKMNERRKRRELIHCPPETTAAS